MAAAWRAARMAWQDSASGEKRRWRRAAGRISIMKDAAADWAAKRRHESVAWHQQRNVSINHQ